MRKGKLSVTSGPLEGVLPLLHLQEAGNDLGGGLPEDRLTAVGMADTRVRDPGESAAAHRRNRRLEVHLVYGSMPPS